MTQEDSYRPVEMTAFFDSVADTYDAHRSQHTSYNLDSLFAAVASAIEGTSREVRILDLGVGTGAELEWMLARVPNARVTCIDTSKGMLNELRSKYTELLGQMDIITGSFLEIPFQNRRYQYVVSVQSMHHLNYERKLNLYRRIREALAPGGKYIEGDHVLPENEGANVPRGTSVKLKLALSLLTARTTSTSLSRWRHRRGFYWRQASPGWSYSTRKHTQPY